MKKSTIDRICENHERGKLTYMGAYAYNVQFHPMAGKFFVIRCPRDLLGQEWIDHDGNMVNGWDFWEVI